jgi:hypothetical protein
MPGHHDLIAQRGERQRRRRAAAEPVLLAVLIEDHDRRLARDTAGAAKDIAVKIQVTNDEDAPAAEPAKQVE